MFKNKNRVTKFSNFLFIFIFLVSVMGAINFAIDLSKGSFLTGYTRSDYIYNLVSSIAYSLISGIILFLSNKKMDLYKDEYPLTKQIFNVINIVMVFALVTSLISLISGQFIYNKFSFYALFGYLFGLVIIIGSYFYAEKLNMLNMENDKKTNIVNFIVIILFREYVYDFIVTILQLIFKQGKVLSVTKNMILYLIGMCVVFLAYKLFEKSRSKEQHIEKKEVKVIKNENLTTKNKKSKKKGVKS